MKSTFRTLLAILGLAAATADAAFHLWRMTEIYSNADGSVQFLELSTRFNGENLIAGHNLTSTHGGTTRTFTFPTNVNFVTANKTLLIGTAGFAALGVVEPDYVVPNGFFSAGGGVVNFASVDQWTYPALPATEGLSLERNGTVAAATPTNFAGQTGTLGAALNFQALWWNAPAESESGWGVNIAHQGDILFATWFTYDTDGSGMWLVMSNGAKTGPASYSGVLYRTTGPAFDAAPWNPAQVVATAVGTLSFAFSDADNGVMTYTVNGVTQSKPITRQVYSSPVAACASGVAPGPVANYQDLWWRSPAESESGWGVNLTHQGNIVFATWFTYGSDGRGVWFVMPSGNRTAPGTYSGALYRTTGAPFSAVPWNPAQLGVTEVGTATFTFSDRSNGLFAYTVNGISGSKPITRQVYATPTVCN